MEHNKITAVVTGGASGLGEAAVRAITAAGGNVAILDLNQSAGQALAESIGIERCCYCNADAADEKAVTAALDEAGRRFGPITVAVNCAGIAPAARTVSKKGPMDLAVFEKAIRVNLVGTFNVIRLVADRMSRNQAGPDDERGVIVNTASIAAFDGQIGQTAYAASKAGVVGMTLPLARDLASSGIRVVTIAPGIFSTPMMAAMPEAVRDSLIEQIPFPRRFGDPAEFAAMVMHIIENRALNGETIRLDGAVRMGMK